MQGQRVDQVHGGPDMYPLLKSSEYGKSLEGTWYCVPPGKEPFSFLGDLRKHTVVEHEDGTITVSPSIEIKSHLGTWHGYLERGIWREA